MISTDRRPDLTRVLVDQHLRTDIPAAVRALSFALFNPSSACVARPLRDAFPVRLWMMHCCVAMKIGIHAGTLQRKALRAGETSRSLALLRALRELAKAESDVDAWFHP
eukprot:2253408-Rhodomonas_salina.1